MSARHQNFNLVGLLAVGKGAVSCRAFVLRVCTLWVRDNPGIGPALT